ncbi:glycoprotein-N-acetylgalactosamine 3-beta-galactosyltransferase 1-like [Homarus americanus]|uniref:glycoprotein-N-acetylgalactosamine 3-beta-galactosyltransferase 1-like n=1 Tax=Homarus americanus TaxID=6706 RepID=UPI001C48A0AE|nr:glycoprotein-N-acetylgalactosamine 3-beta-galactosyltransferase 1-like [Homarus americanus]
MDQHNFTAEKVLWRWNVGLPPAGVQYPHRQAPAQPVTTRTLHRVCAGKMSVREAAGCVVRGGVLHCLLTLMAGFVLGLTLALLHFTSLSLSTTYHLPPSRLPLGEWWGGLQEDNVLLSPPHPSLLPDAAPRGSSSSPPSAPLHTTKQNMSSHTGDLPPTRSGPGKKCYGSVAEQLMERVRVLCLVVTYPLHHTTHAIHIYHTWGRRCTKILFVTNAEEEDDEPGDEELPLLTVPHASRGRDGLWNKTRDSFRHAYLHYLDDFEWFVKADDDTYLILENLRYWLHDKDPETPLYYGCHFENIVPKGYMSGGAGYVLSRGALQAFVQAGLRNNTLAHSQGAEDVQMGRFMAAAGVHPGDSRDGNGRPRFFPFVPSDVLVPKAKSFDFWYWQNLAHDHEQGFECCSETTISFHYVSKTLLYTLEFFIYRLKAFGLGMATGDC